MKIRHSFLNRFNILSFFLYNGFAYLVLLFLQFLMFAFLPSISSDIPEGEQRRTAIQFILTKDILLVFEALVGLFILYWINRSFVFYGDKKRSILIAIIILIMLLSSIFYFSLDYIHKFPAK
jgi:hypothetical protein